MIAFISRLLGRATNVPKPIRISEDALQHVIHGDLTGGGHVAGHEPSPELSQHWDRMHKMLRETCDNLPARLPQDSSDRFNDMLAENELGEAFYTLIWAIGWNRMAIRQEDLDRIGAAGSAMGLDPSGWPGLHRLVTDPNAFGPPPSPDKIKSLQADLLKGRYYYDGTPKQN